MSKWKVPLSDAFCSSKELLNNNSFIDGINLMKVCWGGGRNTEEDFKQAGKQVMAFFQPNLADPITFSQILFSIAVFLSVSG